MSKTRKISPAMEAVLTAMDSGWELAFSDVLDGRCWLRMGVAGRGGESRRVNANTFHALLASNLIRVRKRGFPTTTWELTDAGRAHLGTDAAATEPVRAE